MSVMNKLEWRGVSKQFGTQKVLDGLDLAVAPGRSLALLGRSGQGKSVTIKLALGLMQADAGEILLDGVDVTHLPARERRASFAGIGMLFRGFVRQPAGLGKRRLSSDQCRWRGQA
jgi:phospholipid/cholesterol/gamma-HCH transport system ATP-binding protein